MTPAELLTGQQHPQRARDELRDTLYAAELNLIPDGADYESPRGR
jgi:hypothetical protein